jgi:cobalt/nickel transport protein
MKPYVCLVLGLFGLAGTGAPTWAHYQMLLPETASAPLDREVALVYQWGHPFEHQLFDAAAPRRLLVIAPGGKQTDVTKSLTRITLPGRQGKKVIAFRLRYTPRQRGDYLFVLTTAPIWMKQERVFFQDTVKVVLHVEDQDGWDAATGQPFELVPLTRPYGLRPGMVFQAQVLAADKPVPRTLIEIEHYNASPPRELPADEQITRTAKTDPGGVVTYTLTESGWWCLTAQRKGGRKERDGKAYVIRERTTLWVFVDEKEKPRAEK